MAGPPFYRWAEVCHSLNIVVAGNDAATCTLLRVLLEEESGFHVVGCARNGRELIILAQEHVPQIVVVDLDAPGDGLGPAISTLKSRPLSPSFVGLFETIPTDSILLSKVDGRLSKHEAFSTLATSIRGSGMANGGSADTAPETLSKIGNDLKDADRQLYHLYARDLERRQRELAERVSLTELWLTELAIDHTAPAAELTATVTRQAHDDSARVPIIALSVDGFFNAQHKVNMDGKEGTIHPHSWRVSVRVLVESGGHPVPTVGFADAKRVLKDTLSKLDGKVLNNLPQFAELVPTSENVAAQLFSNLRIGYREMMLRLESVTLWESPTNAVTYSEAAL